MQVHTPEVSAEKATTPAEHRIVSVEQLKKIHRDLDACQKVIWLAGCRPRGYGFDPSYVTDAQERLKEIEALLEKQAPAQVTAAMWKAAHNSMESDGDLALALQEALNAAPQSGQTDRLRAEVEALRKDAERYRWLRDKNSMPGVVSSNSQVEKYFNEYMLCGVPMDKAIDAAMAAKR
ncbi:hypothetical protein [Stutzerimonas nitrititolerans]|uniref:hypothetical protein n=1 Tax=Stutzerimonas nitrititolerans TaxID=2482751 RepID=UPI0028A9F610|nr:hypothetical protein [Stutzerimonas nitrititolerans]